jgi:hypothetical protein
MSNRITFSRLEKVLADLGFQKRVVPSEGVAYDYGPTRTLLVVSLHKSNELVPDFVLTSIRHQLDAQGVIPSAKFESLLQSAA